MNPAPRTALRTVWGSARRTAVGLLIAVLVVSNVATLLSEQVHDALVGAITSVAALGGATMASKVLSHSAHARKQAAVAAATRDAQTRLAAQTSKLQALERKHLELGAQTKLLAERQQKAAQQTQQLAKRAKQRLARTVARNTGALAGEAVPALGLVVAVGVTALDVVDACDAIKDWNTSLALYGQSPLDTASVCGVRVPSSKEVLAGLSSTWRQSADLVAAELRSMQLSIEQPIAHAPTLVQLRQATCPIVKLVGLCN